MRSGWERDAHQLIVDVGALGCPISSGHGHADLLSVQCAAFGEPVLVDAGTGCYTADLRWRSYFRGTAAHSTVRVDERDQTEPTGPFRWQSRPVAKVREWHSDDQVDVVDAEHYSYGGADTPLTCRRRVIFVKPHYWVLVDDIDGRAQHQIEVAFQFAPIRVTRGPESWVRAETAKGRVFWVAAFASQPLKVEIACGGLAPIRGWMSSDYGQRQPAPMLTYSSLATLPWRCLTLLFPEAASSALAPPVSPLYDRARRPLGLTFERSGTSMLIPDP
jgi:hypothetical protein